MVHGLDTKATNVEKPRAHIGSLGLYGKVSVDRLAGKRLPYVDNLVNLIVSEELGKISMSEVMRVLTPNGVAYIKTYWFHHRCYRSKATDRFLLLSRTGIEFVDFEKEHWDINHWVRGGCIYGIMPANGLVYAPPHSCVCYIDAKQFGFNALAPASKTRKIPSKNQDAKRLERSPVYNRIDEASWNSRRSRSGTEWPRQTENSTWQ